MSLNLQTPCLRTTAKDVLWYVIHVTGFLNARIKGSTFCFDLARTPRTRELTQPPNSKDPVGTAEIADCLLVCVPPVQLTVTCGAEEVT